MPRAALAVVDDAEFSGKDPVASAFTGGERGGPTSTSFGAVSSEASSSDASSTATFRDAASAAAIIR